MFEYEDEGSVEFEPEDDESVLCQYCGYFKSCDQKCNCKVVAPTCGSTIVEIGGKKYKLTEVE